MLTSTLTLFCIYHFLIGTSRRHLPPGPRPAFFIGNALQLGSKEPEILFQQWAAKFGHILYMHVLGQPMIVLSSQEAVRDLMEKRSAIYSDRPRFVLLNELMGWQSASTHVRYGPRFRKHRRFIHQTFNARAVSSFRPLQEQETAVLLDGLIQSPHKFVQHFRRYAAATIFPITYGHKITSVDDHLVRLAERAGTLTIASGTPAATLVDYLPLLKYIPAWAPFAGFKRKALETRKAVDKMMNIPFDMVKKNMRSGTATPSFTSSLLEAHCTSDKEAIAIEDEEDIIKGAAGTLFAAAEDTTVAIMESFILAMVRYPEVYKKAQEEIDRVIGSERLLTINDRGSLPYLECVLKELFRWNPPLPLGFPHRVMEDDSYQGYHIPNGATIIANIYAMLQDCSQPHVFRPERFIDDPNISDPREVVFGFGRRICPGRHFGETNVWYMIANITATLDISKSTDDEGKEITPPFEVICSFVRHPKPFSCSIRPRSEKATSLIHDAKL
ncbi:cytochrome P450 [Tricholoma matsutake]|nr:cytochrome P450 [Tricholoma matsutake 945]